MRLIGKFTFLFLFNPIIVSLVSAQSNERSMEGVAAAVQLYFDGMMERDSIKLKSAFFEQAHLIGYRADSLYITPFNEWMQGTAKGTARNKKEFINKISAIEIKGNTAMVKAELYWTGIYYHDYLTLIFINGQWKIVHKSWYEEKI